VRYAAGVPRKAKPNRGRPKRFAIYWVSTADGDEDCFVVAASAREARRFLEGTEGYDPGDAESEHIRPLPDHLQDGTGWRSDRASDFDGEPSYATREVLVACGGEIAEQRSDPQREVMGVVTADVRFGSRVFRAGDLMTNVMREQGRAEPARLAEFAGQKTGPSFPDWWEWELEFTPHLEKRMSDRDFTEVDLREMLEHARGYHPDVVEDRFLVETRFRGKAWEVVVEPDETDHLLVVVTAYGVDR